MYAVDPITIEVIKNYMQSAARQMRSVLVRTSCNPVIYEMIDFTLGLYNKREELLAEAPGIPHFMGALRFAIQNIMEHVGKDNVRDGDVIFATHIYTTGSHAQDANIIRPIFVDGKLFGYAAAKAHLMDIGAKDVYATDSTDIWQEGLQIHGAKIRNAGVQNKELEDIIRANTRFPDSVMGDINAQIAACELGAIRVQELVRKYGVETVEQALDAMLDQGEAMVRQAILDAPDGEWSADGALDDNGVVRKPVPIKVTVRIQKDELTVDTTGSAEQQGGPVNSPLAATISIARLAIKRLISPNTSANEGHFRPISVVAPPGSMFNARPPAPAFLYHLGPQKLGELVMSALAQALPRNAVAGSGGNECAVLFSGVHPRTNAFFAGAAIEGVGDGAGCDADGENALIVYTGGQSQNIPVEVIEAEYPIHTLRYELRQDSGGPGKFRGGLGAAREWRTLADLRCISVVEQTLFAPHGVFGGRSGAPNTSILNAGTNNECRLGKVSDFHTLANAEWHVYGGGGGGWGDPIERDSGAVLADVVQGYVSVESAEMDYGVVVRFVDGEYAVDERETANRRGSGRR